MDTLPCVYPPFHLSQYTVSGIIQLNYADTMATVHVPSLRPPPMLGLAHAPREGEGDETVVLRVEETQSNPLHGGPPDNAGRHTCNDSRGSGTAPRSMHSKSGLSAFLCAHPLAPPPPGFQTSFFSSSFSWVCGFGSFACSGVSAHSSGAWSALCTDCISSSHYFAAQGKWSRRVMG